MIVFSQKEKSPHIWMIFTQIEKLCTGKFCDQFLSTTFCCGSA